MKTERDGQRISCNFIRGMYILLFNFFFFLENIANAKKEDTR